MPDRGDGRALLVAGEDVPEAAVVEGVVEGHDRAAGVAMHGVDAEFPQSADDPLRAGERGGRRRGGVVRGVGGGLGEGHRSSWWEKKRRPITLWAMGARGQPADGIRIPRATW